MKLDKVALVPSNNGYGHLRRLSSLIPALTDHNFKVSLFWDERVTFPRHIFGSRLPFELELIKTPLHLDGPFVRSNADYSFKLLEEVMSRYLFVISDTVTWPAKVHKRTIFLTQFFWEMYYSEIDSHSEFWRKAVSSLPNTNLIYTMEHFSWLESSNYPNLRQIPIVDYWNLRQREEANGEDLVKLSSGTNQSNAFNSIAKELNFKDDIKQISGMENYVESARKKPLGVLCRAGLGAISESISARSYCIFLPDDDFEIKKNSNIAIELGVGFSYSAYLDKKEDFKNYLFEKRKKTNWPDVLSSDNLVDKIIGEL
jgi:hypothetical protein